MAGYENQGKSLSVIHCSDFTHRVRSFVLTKTYILAITRLLKLVRIISRHTSFKKPASCRFHNPCVRSSNLCTATNFS